LDGKGVSVDLWAGRDRPIAWPDKKAPAWAVAAFAAVVAAAYCPNVVHVFSILDDYDVLYFKSEHFYLPHLETEHLLSIARPIAAVFTNLFILFVQSVESLRWLRVFSILTVCVLGAQMIGICVFRLRTRVPDALAVTLGAFLGLPFIYAIVDATAWAPHLLTTFFAFCGYILLGRSNIQSILLLTLLRRGEYRASCRRLLAYSFSPHVLWACLVFQIALFSYPPYALMLIVFPVIGVLFSQAPRAYRTLIAARDVVFIGVNLVLYSLSTALIYLPFFRLFSSKGSGMAGAYESELVAALYAPHQFKYNTDISDVIRRLERLMTVSGDLWFLPQTGMHMVTGAVLLMAVIAANIRTSATRRLVACSTAKNGGDLGRLRFDSGASEGMTLVLVSGICFTMAASPILGSAGGFVAYRTAVGAISVLAIIFIFAVRGLAEFLWSGLGNSRYATAKVGNAALAAILCAAFSVNFYANYVIMKLARNENAYFTGIVRQAIASKSKAVIVIDPRPSHGAEDYNPWPVYDQQGRAVPPMDVACFSSFCRQTGGIVRILAKQLGQSYNSFEIVVPRDDDPVPGLNCEMLTAVTPSYPPNASEHSISVINQYRAMSPLTCVMLEMAWHDLGADLSL
jgi:hypothetical protein